MTNLSNGDHQLLVHWFRSLDSDRLSGIARYVGIKLKRIQNVDGEHRHGVARNLLQLVTIRQFPPADKSLPPLNKSKWWIPTATKVQAICNIYNIPASTASTIANIYIIFESMILQ